MGHVQNLLNYFQYDLYWPLAPTLCFYVSFVVSGMQRVDQEAYIYGCSLSYASSSIFYNNNLSSFNPSHPHVHPSNHPPHHKHLTSLSLSRRQVRLPLVPLPQRPTSDPTQTQGKVERTPLTSQVKLYLGKVHSRRTGICIDRSTKLCRGLH